MVKTSACQKASDGLLRHHVSMIRMAHQYLILIIAHRNYYVANQAISLAQVALSEPKAPCTELVKGCRVRAHRAD